MAITIPARRLLWASLAVAALFSILGGLGEYSGEFLAGDPLRSLRAFDFARGNVPTWFTSAAFLTCALLLLIIAAHTHRASLRAALLWGLLALLLLALSVNEIFAVEHSSLLDYASRALRLALGTDGLTTLVVIGGGVSVAGVVLYSRFFLSLPAGTRRAFLVAGVVYLGGAIGLELASTLIVRLAGNHSLLYLTVSNIEELAEVAGVLIFLYALLAYIEQRIGPITLAVRQ